MIRIGDEGVKQIVAAISSCSCVNTLHKLSLSLNFIRQSGARYIGDFVRLSKLYHLNLSGNQVLNERGNELRSQIHRKA